MEEILPGTYLPTPIGHQAPSISAFVAVGRESHGGLGHNGRGGCGGRGMPNKCSACGSLDHIMSSNTALDNALLKQTLARHNVIVHKYGTPGGNASTHAAVLSDVSHDDSPVLASLEAHSRGVH
jgi:hypothetical protein